MVKNMGSVDRVVRAVLGAAFIVAAVVLGGWFWILGALGVVFLVTAAASSCPLYMPFAISTRKKTAQ
jgi:predicted phage tail protein